MDKYNVYINVATRPNGAKVDYAILFEKNDVIWYKFAGKVLDEWRIGDTIGTLQAVLHALKFAREHNIHIVINSNNGLVVPDRLEQKMQNKLKFRNEYIKNYLSVVKSSSDICEFNILADRNKYHDYNRKIVDTKFGRRKK